MVGVAEVKGDEIERIYLYLPLPVERGSDACRLYDE